MEAILIIIKIFYFLHQGQNSVAIDVLEPNVYVQLVRAEVTNAHFLYILNGSFQLSQKISPADLITNSLRYLILCLSQPFFQIIFFYFSRNESDAPLREFDRKYFDEQRVSLETARAFGVMLLGVLEMNADKLFTKERKVKKEQNKLTMYI